MYILPFIYIAFSIYPSKADGGTDDTSDSNNHTSNQDNSVVSSNKLVMGSFLNKQGIRIRTYASRVENPKGHVILVHGFRTHFRCDFCKYDAEWHVKNVGEYPNPDAQRLFEREIEDILPDLESLNKDGTVCGDPLHGKNAFDLTPRFKYHGSFLYLLNNLGFSAYGLDLQSNGLSGGLNKRRSYAKQLEDYVYDVLQFVGIVKRGKFDDLNEKWDDNLSYHDYRHDNRPYYILGLSLGGNLVFESQKLFDLNIIRPGKFVDALIAMSALFKFDYYPEWVNNMFYPILRLHVLCAPKRGIVFEQRYDGSEGLIPCMRSIDPLFHSKRMASKTILHTYQATKFLRRNIDLYPKDLPTLLIHSKDDPMCSSKGPKYYMENHFNDCKDVKLVELDGKTHIITMPSHYFQVEKILKQWFNSLDKM